MASSPSSRRSRPTSAPSVDDFSSTSSIQMQRSSSADQNRVSKRKGTRSVSTLTPAQLARKRANDREAQRAIRARTKDHIERLEAELDELRSERHRDQTVQELLRRNKMLEEELKSIRESMGISFNNGSSYSTGAINSPRTSPYPSSEFASNTSAPLGDYTAPGYVPFANPNPNPTSNNCENWAAAVSASVPSNVSSPCSSATDEYGTGPAYLPTSAPNSMVPSPVTSGLRTHEDIKLEYEDAHGMLLSLASDETRPLTQSPDHGFLLEHRSNSSGPGSHVGTPPMQPGFMMPQHHQPANAWGPNAAVYYAPMSHQVY